MRILLLLLLTFLVGCEPPQSFEDDPDMIRQSRNPPIARVPAQGIVQVAPVIPREGLWSGYNQLGYQAKYGPDNRGSQTILKLDEWGPPEVWTLSLFLRQEFKVFGGFNVWAEILFGAGGSTQLIEVDWTNGAQISVPMNAVNVVAHFENVDVTTEGAGLSLGVQLARGARGGTNPPVRTMLEDRSINTGVIDLLVEIPPFARNVVIIPSEGTAAELAAFYTAGLIFFTLSGNAIGTTPVAATDGTRADDGRIVLPVTGQSKFARVRNASGVNLHYTMYAELDG